MNKKIKAVVFDWAGTTVDYGSFAPVQAFIEAFKKFDVAPTTQEVRVPMGMLKWKHIETIMKMQRVSDEWEKTHKRKFTKEDVDAVYKESETALLNILENFADVKPHVLDTISFLRENGIKIGSTTGYTDQMMDIVVPKAKTNGYSPDFWCTANSTNNMGRPYPYMLFKNLETLKILSTDQVIKVGDTAADIAEGKNAGVISVGIVEGSSVMGYSEMEYNSLSDAQKQMENKRVEKVYKDCKADYIIKNMSEVPALIKQIEDK